MMMNSFGLDGARLVLLIVCAVCASSNASVSSYSGVRLNLPPVWVFYDATRLTEAGSAGGYIRVSNQTDPVDVPTIWNADGNPATLPISGTYRQSFVMGFRTDGTPLGLLRTPTNFPGPAGYWDAAGFNALPDFGDGGVAIDGNAQLICGDTYVLEGGFFRPRATIWDASGARRVQGLGDIRSQCFAVNESGVYVGAVNPTPTSVRAFVGTGGTATLLTRPGYELGTARDINDDNWIVGTWVPGGQLVSRGFIASAFGDDFRDLGGFASEPGVVPWSINNAGEIVGVALSDTGAGVRALYWPPGATSPVDLNTLVDLPGVTLVEAMDINDAGQILARGTGGYYIFTPVPEPGAALTFLVIGGAAQVIGRRGSRSARP
jgi:hypothetical protein